MKKKATFNIKVPLTVFKEGKIFIAYSPVLDLSTSASSFEKVQKRFIEVVNIFIEELIEMGTVDEVLSDLGWRKTAKQWHPPLPVGHDIADVSVSMRN